jgi:hypothetical protein
MEFFELFTFHNLLFNIILTAIISILWRGIMWLYNKTPKKELLYWIFIPLLVLVVISSISFLDNQSYNKIKISGTIEAVNIHSDNNDTRVLLIVSVRNVGSPTILDNWIMRIESEDGNIFYGRNEALPETLTLFDEKDSTKYIYSDKDAIYEKFIVSPLQTGEFRIGIYWVVFKGISKDIISQPGNKFIIQCADVTNNLHYFFIVPNKRITESVHIPGLSEN